MTLVEFLTARLDEDEAVAQAADSGVRTSIALHVAEKPGIAPVVGASPARVLREVAAKRAVVAAAAWVGVKRASDNPLGMATDSGADGQEYTLGWVLRHLAAIYADHPDYREEWQS